MKQLTIHSVTTLTPGDTIVLITPSGQHLKGIVSEIGVNSFKITLASGGNYLVMGSTLYEGDLSFEFPDVTNSNDKSEK